MCFVTFFNSMLIRKKQQKTLCIEAQGFEYNLIQWYYSEGLLSSPAIASRIEVSAIIFLYFI